MNKSALFCDESGNFRIPMEPTQNSTVKIRFRTAKGDASQVYLIYDNKEILMEIESEDVWFDYYQASVFVGTEPLSYYFEVISGKEICYYGKLGAKNKAPSDGKFWILPGFSTPEWAKGALMYQIYVDRFANGCKENDVLTNEYYYNKNLTEQVKDWNAIPDPTLDVHRFYGGDLQGVMEKLDYFKKLGVQAIYFNPIFVSPSNHKYDAQDYEAIDPHLGVLVKDEGEVLPDDATDNEKATRFISRVASKENLEATEEYFIQLVEKAHEMGIRVILDGVFNHCGSFNKWLDREKIYERGEGFEQGAYASPDSPYHNYFKFHTDEWPDNPSYEGWWGFDTLPKLNYEDSLELQEHILEIGRKWVSPPYNVDGWRLDVAADLGHSEEFNHQFWKKFRKVVKEANPEALIIAEHYGSPEKWLRGDEWDSVMNYDAFMEPVTWFLTGMEKHSDSYHPEFFGEGEAFFHHMNNNMRCMNGPSIFTAMNQLSNHDHSRFLTRTNQKVGRVGTMGPAAAAEGVRPEVLREAVVMQMTWPGMPTLYYGDEVGVVGWTDPDNRRTYPWGHEDLELLEFHRYMGFIHNHYECLRSGSCKALASGWQFVAYGRFTEEQKAIVLIHNGEGYRTSRVPVWEAGVDCDKLVRILETTQTGYNVGKMEFTVKNGWLEIDMPPFSGLILVDKAIQ